MTVRELQALDYLMNPSIVVLQADREWVAALEVATSIMVDAALEHHLAQAVAS